MQLEAFRWDRSIYPDPMPFVPDMVSWERAVDDFKSFAEPKREAVVDRHLIAVRNHPGPGVRDEVEAALAADSKTARVRLAMLGAAMAGNLTVVVKRRDDYCGYAIIKHVWQRSHGLVASPVRMALAGRFLSCLAMPGSLEMHLAGADLFIRADEFRKMTTPRPASKVEIDGIVRSIIADFEVSQPGMRLTNDEFLKRLPPHIAATSKRTLLSRYCALKPKAWKKGGRPRSHAG